MPRAGSQPLGLWQVKAVAWVHLLGRGGGAGRMHWHLMRWYLALWNLLAPQGHSLELEAQLQPERGEWGKAGGEGGGPGEEGASGDFQTHSGGSHPQPCPR